MNRIANFIDGGYLDALLKNEWDGREINYKLLTDKMTNDFDLLRTYYYHCPPFEVDEPTDWQKEFYTERKTFFRKLETVPRFENRLGQLQYRGKDQKGHPIFEQKRVDLMFGVDLVMLATKGLVSHVSILAGDSDFIPALQVIKSEGVVVHLFCGKTPHQDLRSIVDEVIVIDKRFMDAITIKTTKKPSTPKSVDNKQKQNGEPKQTKQPAKRKKTEVKKPKPETVKKNEAPKKPVAPKPKPRKPKKNDSKNKVDLGFLSDKKTKTG